MATGESGSSGPKNLGLVKSAPCRCIQSSRSETRAFYSYCEEFAAETRLDVDFRLAGLKTMALDPSMEINLYRLIQEGLINIRKHAQASRVVVTLTGANPNIILRIEDDGRGFDVIKRERELDRERRLSLRSMKERASLLQGHWRIESQSGKGTRIFVKIPS